MKTAAMCWESGPRFVVPHICSQMLNLLSYSSAWGSKPCY